MLARKVPSSTREAISERLGGLARSGRQNAAANCRTGDEYRDGLPHQAGYIVNSAG